MNKEETIKKENKRGLRQIVRDGVVGAAVGAILFGLLGVLFGWLIYTNTPQATAASTFYPILISLAGLGATAGAIFGGDRIYLEKNSEDWQLFILLAAIGLFIGGCILLLTLARYQVVGN